MPPKAAAAAITTASGKDDSGKRLKDLELLLACAISSTNAIEIDYDEFIKHDDAPTRTAAQKRVQRMSKALGVTIKAAPKIGEPAKPKAKPAAKKQAEAKKITTKSSEEDEEDDASPKKKQKLVKDARNVKGDEEA